MDILQNALMETTNELRIYNELGVDLDPLVTEITGSFVESLDDFLEEYYQLWSRLHDILVQNVR